MTRTQVVQTLGRTTN